MDLAIIIAVVAVALIFDYTNGFHDAANAIATSVSTRALTPRAALAMAAVMNFIGAFLGQGRLDLRQATIPAGGTAVVDVFAFMAGHEIYVPPGWEVVADTVLMLAKVQDARLPPIERRPPDAPRLQLRGFAMIGEIVIRT